MLDRQIVPLFFFDRSCPFLLFFTKFLSTHWLPFASVLEPSHILLSASDSPASVRPPALSFYLILGNEIIFSPSELFGMVSMHSSFDLSMPLVLNRSVLQHPLGGWLDLRQQLLRRSLMEELVCKWGGMLLCTCPPIISFLQLGQRTSNFPIAHRGPFLPVLSPYPKGNIGALLYLLSIRYVSHTFPPSPPPLQADALRRCDQAHQPEMGSLRTRVSPCTMYHTSLSIGPAKSTCTHTETTPLVLIPPDLGSTK